MARTLVTGATGFIGSKVLSLLLDRGDEVVAMLAPGAPNAGLRGLGVEPARADVRDRRAVRRAMRGGGRLFHIAGVTSLTAPRELAFSVNVEGTRIVLEEALRAGLERVVLTSSVAAVGPAPPGCVADETNDWHAVDHGIPQIESKREAELTALGFVGRGLPVVVVNPALVVGAGGEMVDSTRMVRSFLAGHIPMFVDGTLNIVGVEDVARGHLLADERGEPGERYILGNRNFTTDRLLADLGRLSGVEPPAVKLPVAAALLLAAAAQRLPCPVALPTPVEIRAASLNWAFSSAKAKRELGWRTSPHEDCLEAAIGWSREHDSGLLARARRQQPLPLRLAGSVLRRLPL